MADQDGRHSELITQLLRHVTSSPHDVKGDIFRRPIYIPGLVVIDFISRSYGERGGGEGGGGRNPPVVEDQNRPVEMGLKSSNFHLFTPLEVNNFQKVLKLQNLPLSFKKSGHRL